jgi:hypothetical protein
MLELATVELKEENSNCSSRRKIAVKAVDPTGWLPGKEAAIQLGWRGKP